MKNKKEIINWLFSLNKFEYINYWEIVDYGIGNIIRVPGWNEDDIPEGKEEEFLKDLNKELKKAKANKNLEVEECDGKIYSMPKEYVPLLGRKSLRDSFY